MLAKKIVRVGFDLDGVIIGKPPFVPKFVMEWLVRLHYDHQLAYRYPGKLVERQIRWLSHHPLLRPPIRRNIKLIKELYRSRNYKLYIISGRYSFLENRTREWFRFYRLNKFFEKIFINLENEQPHLFKEKMIKKLKLKVFIDDDIPLLEYLKKRLKDVELVSAHDQEKHLKGLNK